MTKPSPSVSTTPSLPQRLMIRIAVSTVVPARSATSCRVERERHERPAPLERPRRRRRGRGSACATRVSTEPVISETRCPSWTCRSIIIWRSCRRISGCRSLRAKNSRSGTWMIVEGSTAIAVPG